MIKKKTKIKTKKLKIAENSPKFKKKNTLVLYFGIYVFCYESFKSINPFFSIHF